MEKAYITIVSNTEYVVGFRVMSRSLKKTGTDNRLYVCIPNDRIEEIKPLVEDFSDGIIGLENIEIGGDYKNENSKQYWNETFSKLQIMSLAEFEKVVYIDSDMLILNNIDALFEYPSISATTGGKSAHPEYIEFNSGLMVIEPDIKEYDKLIKCINPAIERKKTEGKGYGDQDVFNEYYKDWNEHVEHNFGEENNALCVHLDALMKAKGYKNLNQVNVIHYVGPQKIWNNSIQKNLRLIIRYIHERRFYTAKAWWLYMRWMKRVRHL